jgi:hypothetical protein
MGDVRYLFNGGLWRWQPETGTAWYLVRLPEDASDEIRQFTGPRGAGFGSVRVQVRLGGSLWSTSIFPEAASGCYLLPVKKAIRTAEKIDDGDEVMVELELV